MGVCQVRLQRGWREARDRFGPVFAGRDRSVARGEAPESGARKPYQSSLPLGRVTALSDLMHSLASPLRAC